MSYYELSDDPLTLSEIETQSISLIIKVQDFSNETIHKSGKQADIDNFAFEDDDHQIYALALFANGMTNDDKGYVTVEFWIDDPGLTPFYKVFEFSCVFSVIDAFENKRFPQSYVIDTHSYWSSQNGTFFSIIVDRLLKRDFLLSDKDDLLPGDCLSLHIEFEIRAIDCGPDYFVEYVVKHSFAATETADGTKYYLHLDSGLCKQLANFSAYFQRMLETPMVECKTRRMEVAKEEYISLKNIGKILMRVKEITVDSISDICQMYITADKYDIPIAVESCRDLLTSFLGVENDSSAEDVKAKIPTLLDLAETYNDVRLKGIIDSFLKNNREDEDEDFDRCTQKRLQSNPETEWKLDRRIYKFTTVLTFIKNTKEKPGVNVYK